MKSLIFNIVFFISISFNINGQWYQANGPYGGSASCFVISGNNIFAGTSTGGVFLSTNNGNSWNQTNLMNTPITTLAVLDNNIFAGSYEDGILRSTDNGLSWTQINNGLTSTYINDLTVSNTNILLRLGVEFLFRRIGVQVGLVLIMD